MKIKMGVMGSATGNFSKKIKEISYELGCAIAKNDCVTIEPEIRYKKMLLIDNNQEMTLTVRSCSKGTFLGLIRP